MGICLSALNAQREKTRRQRISQIIDCALEVEQRLLKNECTILLIGKSAIVEQMKKTHQHGYSREELAAIKLAIYRNLLSSAQCLLLSMEEMGLEFFNPENRAYADSILAYQVDVDPNFRLSPDIVIAIDSLYHDPITTVCMKRSSQSRNLDSASYLFSQVQRIGADSFTPNAEDVLWSRPKTAGIWETQFNMGQLRLKVVDVSELRSTMKKWIHCFEAVTSIIFCVALSDYDQVVHEESGQNRLIENLELFESIINSRWFSRTSIILFFTKIDVFARKLPNAPLEKFFADYTGGPDISKAAKYILWRFTQTNRARLQIYPHLTTVTDPLNIRHLFAAVKETILQNALKDCGVI